MPPSTPPVSLASIQVQIDDIVAAGSVAYQSPLKPYLD